MSSNGKTAIVTGSAGGLGRVIADTLLAKGYNVVICDSNAERLASIRDAYRVSHPTTALLREADVTSEASVEALVAAAVEAFGGLHVVVNNAGIMDRFDPAGTCDAELWHRVLAVNLTGPFLVTKHAVRYMEASSPPGGLIVNIGSNASLHGLSGGVAYAASKHGLLAVSRNTAGTYGPSGIYSVALLLGGMEGTNIADSIGGDNVNVDGMQRMFATQPGFHDPTTKRTLELADVARYVAFLGEDGIGRMANGSSVVLNCNWPEA